MIDELRERIPNIEINDFKTIHTFYYIMTDEYDNLRENWIDYENKNIDEMS